MSQFWTASRESLNHGDWESSLLRFHTRNWSNFCLFLGGCCIIAQLSWDLVR